MTSRLSRFSGSATAERLKVRPPGVAGSFYPADPSLLLAMMEEMLANAPQKEMRGEIVALVAPHAGYRYCGHVAARSYGALKGRKFARVVVLAPSHYDAFSYASVYDGDGYETPLGMVPVDKEFVNRLAGMHPSIRMSERGHLATVRGAEHALEVQLPWLQHMLRRFTLVPIVMGSQSYESSRALGVALARLIAADDAMREQTGEMQRQGGTLIVASSDLSHYRTAREAEEIDHKTLGAMETWDYFSMSRNLGARVWEACGGAPIVAAMIAAERMGANQAEVLGYGHSGEVTRDRYRVVGYGAAALVKGEAAESTEKTFRIGEADRSALMALARGGVERAVLRRPPHELPSNASETLLQERGAFVTLTKGTSLRGCIGFTSPSRPLGLAVRDAAAMAALHDPRFRSVVEAELPLLGYEISVLSPMRRVQDVERIEVGRHGLLIKNGEREGLLLPQVPVEHGWDRTQFLEETCMKAGSPPEIWKEEDTDIFCFTAEVFEEAKPAA